MAKALSIKEPYATLIRDGVKRIETRSWKTNYRGELYIHASACKIPKEYRDNEALMSIVGNRTMHYGQIIAKANLVDCIPITDSLIKEIGLDEYICGFYSEGRYAWVLEDVELIEPVKAKGKLGIWEVEIL